MEPLTPKYCKTEEQIPRPGQFWSIFGIILLIAVVIAGFVLGGAYIGAR
ncbi:MAG: hypothetical protein ACRD7E_15995 [Bryobacteraceae bacterium]